MNKPMLQVSTITRQDLIRPEEAALGIERLIQYALHKQLIEELDVVAARNALLAELRLEAPHSPLDLPSDSAQDCLPDSPYASLSLLLDYAAQEKLLMPDTDTYRDLLLTKLMGKLMPRPSEVVRSFREKRQQSGIRAATDYLYQLSIDSGYIRMDRIARNKVWISATSYGNLEITINLSKPEKDPKEIAIMRQQTRQTYPQCPLCLDNVGYEGRLDHPARQTLRVIPVELADESWYLQYSPYVYYNEHSIVFSGKHRPMQISAMTFERLLEFLDCFPHYFIGSNADLPIVGGSILSHDHYQAGHHQFPMQESPVTTRFRHSAYPDVSAGLVRWPLSVVRLSSNDASQLVMAATAMLDAWRTYSDFSSGILAFSGDIPHNTITPIARKGQDGTYILDLVLRNNRTDDCHPEGIFHPHRHLHAIKKENIGLIEVMGLAVLPARLDQELSAIASVLTGANKLADLIQQIPHHMDWINALVQKYGAPLSAETTDEVLRQEVGAKFLEVLECCGVFKQTEAGQHAFIQFMEKCGYTKL